MLVLKRGIGKKIFINNNEIIIQVLGIDGNQVKLGIEAPLSTKIHREEVWTKIQNGEVKPIKGEK
jgi:carbon storage regulator